MDHSIPLFVKLRRLNITSHMWAVAAVTHSRSANWYSTYNFHCFLKHFTYESYNTWLVFFISLIYCHYWDVYKVTALNCFFCFPHSLGNGTFYKQQSTKKEFQKETMFLGVNLLDRFLSKGYFITERNLQIVGISCLALATRIEENQPFNR